MSASVSFTLRFSCVAAVLGSAANSLQSDAVADWNYAAGTPPHMMLVDGKSPVAKTGDAIDNEERRKRKSAQTGLILIVGIALVGLFLIVMVVLWGIRLRRRTKKRPRPTEAYDPLWYLKTGRKQTATPDELTGESEIDPTT